ncbi:amtB [Symbiodinium sp. CCMP2592]|nr:amtB [Symbiodinium sp. CCMP2592]
MPRQTHSTTDKHKHYPAGEVKESGDARLARLAGPAKLRRQSLADALAEVDFLKPSEALHALGPTLVIEGQQTCLLGAMARILRLPWGSSQAFPGHLWAVVPPFRSFVYGVGHSRQAADRAPDLDLPARARELAAKEAGEAGDEEAWLDFEERALQRCGAWRGPEVVQVLHACAVAQRRPKRLLAKLSKDIPDKLPQFDASALCICLHTFAQLRSRDASLFSVVTRRLLQPDHREELGPSHLSSLLYSHARILAFDKGLVRLAQKSLADDHRAFELEDLATVLQAFATLRAEDVRLSGSSARLVAKAAPAAPLPLLADLLEVKCRCLAGVVEGLRGSGWGLCSIRVDIRANLSESDSLNDCRGGDL